MGITDATREEWRLTFKGNPYDTPYHLEHMYTCFQLLIECKMVDPSDVKSKLVYEGIRSRVYSKLIINAYNRGFYVYN